LDSIAWPLNKLLIFCSVPNAKEGRDSVELNIFGMSNVPREVIEERRLKGECATLLTAGAFVF
jgi:hypothetical protein